MTFEQAVAETTASCDSLAEKITKVKVLLDATENALFNAASSGGVTSYRVNTGQTDIKVESVNISQLTRQFRDLFGLYNELCGIAGGSNVMVMRDASTLRR